MKKKVLIINGPNINMTGKRNISIYGTDSYDEINHEIMEYGKELSIECNVIQSNHEGDIIDALQRAGDEYDGIIINAGAYTHYSYTIRDAIETIRIPVIEVHISNIYKREEFRNKSVIAPVCAGHIAGFGKFSYMLALNGLCKIINQ